jgi:outer membrane protein assembly factor BamE (lipoprotein component of BamABCDE complex)
MLFIGILSIEIAREEIVYLVITRKLESGYQQLKVGMNKEQVKQLVGNPDSTINRELEEIWYWDAGKHRGRLWRLLGIATVKGHYTLAVEFNNEGKVTKTWGGVN